MRHHLKAIPDGPIELMAEQLHVVCKSQLALLPINCFLAVSLVLVVRADVDRHILGGWLATIVVVNIMRLVVAIRHQRTASTPNLIHRTLLLQGVSAFVCGLVWAIVPLFMFRLENASAPLVMFILCGVTAGASVMSGTYALCGIAFVFPIMSSIAVRLIATGADGSYVSPLAAVAYMMLVFYAARRSEVTFVNAVARKLKATSLAASLEREHHSTQAVAERFHRLANHDPLTDLPNRSAFANHLTEALAASRGTDAELSLILLDLDHFKSVNDTLGHSAGDEVLKATARRLTSIFGTDHMVARLGGDEFAILYRGSEDGEEGRSMVGAIERLARRILDAISGTFDIGGHEVDIGLSIGVAMFPDDGATAESLLANADLALYAAKGAGRQCWRRFDAALLAEATLARDIERDLPTALARDALQLFYQPQIALDDGRVTGLEGLLRWNHPVHGWISPPLIVAAARRIRRSEALTDYVLGEACGQIHRLSQMGFPDVVVAINISPSELDDYDLPDLVRRSIARRGIDPRRLEVEITEEAFAGSVNALAALSALSAMGVRLAIDDFGTGCSALAYLRTMRVDRIKIDRSFVTGLSERAGDRILVQAILGIGRSFDMEVIAEGVETIEDVRQLDAFQCGLVQGFHFAKPLNESDIKTWLRDRAMSSDNALQNVSPLPAAMTIDNAVAA